MIPERRWGFKNISFIKSEKIGDNLSVCMLKNLPWVSTLSGLMAISLVTVEIKIS